MAGARYARKGGVGNAEWLVCYALSAPEVAGAGAATGAATSSFLGAAVLGAAVFLTGAVFELILYLCPG